MSFEPAHSKGHLSMAAVPKSRSTAGKSVMPTGETPSVTTLGHSLELCIPDVNTLSPWNPQATRQRTRKLQEEREGRQELFARFPGYLCALLAALQACSILHVLSRGSWLLTQMLGEFLGCCVGRKDKAHGKTHARTVFTLLFTIIAGGCHWLMAPRTLRISSTHPGQKKPMKNTEM